MADSGKNAITSYVGDGSTQFAVGFLYLDEAHVEVVVNSVTFTKGTEYDFSDSTTIDFTLGTAPNGAPTGGHTVVFTRVTPHTLYTAFANAATITKTDLDNAILQPIYLTEELQDGATV